GIVVDDGVEVHTSAIDKAKNAGVDVPKLVGARCPNADRWLRWINTASWTSPASLPNEAPPSDRVGEHLFRSLRVKSEGTNGHVAVLCPGDEVSHFACFLKGEASWPSSCTARSV